jgi:hypothetical protein
MKSIQTFVDETIKEDNKKKRADYTQSSWHASSLGNCLRGTYLQRLGVEPDEPMKVGTLRKFKAGELFEEWLIDLLRKNKDIKDVETQTRVESKLYNLSGRLDAMLTYKDGTKEVIECKSQNSRSFWWNIKNGNVAHRHHMYQLWVYLKTLKIENGTIVYISKDDLSIQEYPVKLQDKKLAKEVIDILTLLNKSWKEQNPLLLPLPEKGSWQEKWCPFHNHCIDEKYLLSLPK